MRNLPFTTTLLLYIPLFGIYTYATNSATDVISNTPLNPAKQHVAPDSTIDWDSLGFGLNGLETDFYWLDQIPVSINDDVKYTFSRHPSNCLLPLSTTKITLHPAATVLNYGQSLFEGLKAFRRIDGSIALFRPRENSLRLSRGAKRFLLPNVPMDIFLEAASHVVRANARFVPPTGKGSLYLRPLLFGSGAGLGVKPSTEATFCIYASPVGNYFKGGLKCIKLQAVKGYARAVRGGSGNVKAGGNYAPPFLVQQQVRGRGYDEALFLDAMSGEAIEEAGASNFFAVFANKTIVTPSLDDGTILPGVTRSSIITLAQNHLDYTVYERRLTIDDLKEATEAFCCGTGASITPVGCVSYMEDETNFEIRFGDGTNAGPIAERLYKILVAIQNGYDHVDDIDLKDKYSEWCHVVEP